jgi:hypothetical protein
VIDPRRIAKLITEDPDLFNESWEELGIQDPSGNQEAEYSPVREEAIAGYERLKEALIEIKESPRGPWGVGFLLFQQLFEGDLRDKGWYIPSSADIDQSTRVALAEHAEVLAQDVIWWNYDAHNSAGDVINHRVIVHFISLLEVPDNIGYVVKIAGGIYKEKGDLSWQDPKDALGPIQQAAKTEIAVLPLNAASPAD